MMGKTKHEIITANIDNDVLNTKSAPNRCRLRIAGQNTMLAQTVQLARAKFVDKL